jgi:hypothetical protein
MRRFAVYSPARASLSRAGNGTARAPHATVAPVALVFGGFMALITVLARIQAPVWVIILAAAVAGLSLLLALFWPGEVFVGDDGLVVRWLGQSSFISFADITDVKATYRDLAFLDARGRPYGRRLSSASPSRGCVRGIRLVRSAGVDLQLVIEVSYEADQSAFDRKLETVRDAMTRARERQHDPLPRLARRGRAVSEWLQELALLGRPGSDAYRDPGIARELLWQVLEDATAEHAERAAAAIALRASLDDEGRARLRVAASHCGEPRVRVALENVIASVDDAELHRAMSAFE